MDYNFTGTLQFELYNAAGQLVKSARLNKPHQQVDLGTLAAGIYTYQLLDAGKLLGSSQVVIVD